MAVTSNSFILTRADGKTVNVEWDGADKFSFDGVTLTIEQLFLAAGIVNHVILPNSGAQAHAPARTGSGLAEIKGGDATLSIRKPDGERKEYDPGGHVD